MVNVDDNALINITHIVTQRYKDLYSWKSTDPYSGDLSQKIEPTDLTTYLT